MGAFFYMTATTATLVPDTTRFPTWLGLLQGIVLYALYKTQQEKLWPVGWDGAFNAALLASLTLPFMVYWSHNAVAGPARRALFSGMAALVLGLGAYQGATVYPDTDATSVHLASESAFFGLALLVFMVVPLTSGRTRGGAGPRWGGWDYPVLFEHAWRNAVVTAQAGVLTGLLWAVLALGAQMFHLIGVDWPKEIIQEAWFAIPLTTVSIALGIRSGLRRAAFTVMLRAHWLALTTWLLPLASLIGVAFVLTSLGGVDRLFERGLSAFFLLWFAAFWIKFFNSAYQDGNAEPPLHARLARILPATAPALLAIAGLASWALYVRIAQHGLTPDRIWGALVVGVALVYGSGYSVSLWRRGTPRWMPSIGPTNIVAALAMCIGIVLLLSPVANPDRVATKQQLARLETGRVPADKFDVWALTRQGRAGYDALTALRARRTAAGQPDKLAVRAEDAMNQAAYARDRALPGPDTLVADPRERLEAYPPGAALPDGFVDFLRQDMARRESWERRTSCLAVHETRQKCVLLQVDLDRDGRDEVVLWNTASHGSNRVYGRDANGWRAIGRLQPVSGYVASVRAELSARDYAVEPQRWDALRIGTSKFQLFDTSE